MSSCNTFMCLSVINKISIRVSERFTNKRKILRRSGEEEKGRCLP